MADLVDELNEALHEGDYSRAGLAIELGGGVNAVDCYGHTPLYHAVVRGDAEQVRWLLNRGADVRTETPPDGDTSVHAAARVQRPGRTPRDIRSCAESTRC